VGTPIAMSGTPIVPQAQAPTLGEHTDEILAEHGYSATEITRFREQGAV
jgi:formyl-CoA transferase